MVKTPHYLDRAISVQNDFVKWYKKWIKQQMIPLIEAGKSYDEIKKEMEYDNQNKRRQKRFDEVYSSLASYKDSIDTEGNLNKWLIYGGIAVLFLFIVFILLRLRK